MTPSPSRFRRPATPASPPSTSPPTTPTPTSAPLSPPPFCIGLQPSPLPHHDNPAKHPSHPLQFDLEQQISQSFPTGFCRTVAAFRTSPNRSKHAGPTNLSHQVPRQTDLGIGAARARP